MRLLRVLNSKVDESINNVYADRSEFRLVVRDDHPTVYLSSHTGCSLGCKMCWLTTTGQTKMTPLSQWRMVDGASRLLSQVPRESTEYLNLSFMSRGDPIANRAVNGVLLAELTALADNGGRRVRVNLSTIFPHIGRGPSGADLRTDTLLQRFGAYQPLYYWSLYGLDPTFRTKWLPNAGDPAVVAAMLTKVQAFTMQPVILHHALIAGENSDLGQVTAISEFMQGHRLDYRVNLIRYNAPPGDPHLEASTSTYQEHLAKWTALGVRCKIQARVGPDVYASCGMFYGGDE